MGVFHISSSSFPTTSTDPNQPQPYYNPAVSSPGGPYTGVPTSVPGSQFASYQDRKAETAWNDPPAILEPKKSKEEHSVSFDVHFVE